MLGLEWLDITDQGHVECDGDGHTGSGLLSGWLGQLTTNYEAPLSVSTNMTIIRVALILHVDLTKDKQEGIKRGR